MKRKGFTLPELLAVVIILGLIAVIIIPKVSKSIKESNEKTDLASANGLIKAAEYKWQNNEINGISENILVDYTNNTNTDVIQYTGKKPEKGKVYIKKDGSIAMAVKIRNKCYKKVYSSNEIQVLDYESETCEGATLDNEMTPTPETVVQPEITLGSSTSTISSITVEFTISDPGESGISSTTCKTTSPSEVNGTINNNTCTIEGLSGNTTYTYQITTQTNSGGTDTKTGSKATLDPLEGVLADDGATYLKYDYIVYYNPVTNAVCNNYNEANSTLGYNGITNGGSSISASRTSQTANQTGCLKWYLYSYKGNDANLILDHNITGGSSSWGVEYTTQSDFNNSASSVGITYECTQSWGDESSMTCRGPITALKFLKSQTSSWTTTTPKIPNSSGTNETSTTEDISEGWDYELKQTIYTHFTINYNNYKARMLSGSEIKSIYAKLYSLENRYPSRFGVNLDSNDETNEAYWISYGNSHQNGETFGNYLFGPQVAYNSSNSYVYKYYGIRPVITVSKSSVVPQ